MTGPRPVRLPDITVRGGHLPSAIELAFRQMGMTPAERAQSQADFQARREAFRHDFPRALPSGIPAFAGGALTDVASLDLPFLPPAFPAVRAKGDELTQHLTNYLQRLFGAPAGSEGTQAGTEVGSLVAGVVLPEAVSSILERLPVPRTPELPGRPGPEGTWIPGDPGTIHPGEGYRWTPGKDYQTPDRFTNHDLAGNAYFTSGRIIREPWNAPIVPQYVPPRPVSDVPAYLRPILEQQQRLFREDPSALLPMGTPPLRAPSARVQPWMTGAADVPWQYR